MIRELSESPERDQEWSAILVACLEALDRGEAPDATQLRTRYPQFAEDLARFLDHQQRLDRLAAPLRAVAQVSKQGRGRLPDLVEGVAQAMLGAWSPLP